MESDLPLPQADPSSMEGLSQGLRPSPLISRPFPQYSFSYQLPGLDTHSRLSAEIKPTDEYG